MSEPGAPAGRLGLIAVLVSLAPSLAGAGDATARYRVRLIQAAPPRLSVGATVPIRGRALEMSTTRPYGDIPRLDSGGWPALVTGLRVADASGRPLAAKSAKEKGWLLEQDQAGTLTLEYEVDYAPLHERGWPATRETGFADPDHLALIGRSLFITTDQVRASDVTFDLPAGWHAATSWTPHRGSAADFAVPEAADLVDNLLVLARSAPDEVIAGGFRLLVSPMGHWEAARSDVRRALGAIAPRFVSLMGFTERGNYLVVLLPALENGGESFRHSFGSTLGEAPTAGNLPAWGNTIAHEIFHYWNGWRLRGADYPSSQWFQEGFTEYAANLALVQGGLVGETEFVEKLSEHVNNYRRLETTLEAGGSRKGPPLYSGGALVACCWDARIRSASEGKRDLGDFLEELWRRTGRGARPWVWSDLREALERTAPGDWEAFHRAHIQGSAPLPLAECFSLAGLRLRGTVGEPAPAVVEEDPAAPAPAKNLWKALLAGR